MKSFRRFLRVLGLLSLVFQNIAICEAQTPPMRILPLGDSLTSGVTGSSTTVQGAYRNKLYTLLTNAGYNVDFVGTQTDATNPALPDRDHQGMGGYRIDQLQTGLPSWLGATEDPDVVLLMIGTNDFSANFNVASAQTRLANLLSDLATRRPYAKIILATLPLRADSAALEAQQVAFNSAIPGIVNDQLALSRQVSYVDIHAALLAADLQEGVHPTATGYGKIADTWFPAISSVITPLGTSNPPALLRTEPATDLFHITVKFSKPLADSAANLANFSLNGGLTISQAVLDPTTKRSITLTTSAQTAGAFYILTVNGVKDRTPQQNAIAPGSQLSFSAFSLVNGGFEAGVTGWNMTGNYLVYPTTPPYIASQGSTLVVMNGGQTPPNAVITQAFPTVPGQSYVLEFDMGVLAGNFAAQQLGISVSGAGSLVAQNEIMFGNGLGNSVWAPKSFAFIANSASTVLTFQDQSATSDGIDLLLDNVRVTAVAGPSNGAPTALADNYIVNQNVALVVPPSGVLANDTDPQASPLTAVVNIGPAHGSLTLNANGGFTYTPVTGYSGPDSFTYHANDGGLDSNIATASITVTAAANGSLVNGSFENGETGWTITGNRLVYQSDGTYVATDPQPVATAHMLVLNGGPAVPDAVIKQDFATISGQSYLLTFDIGTVAANTASQTLRVSLLNKNTSASLLLVDASATGNGLVTSAWTAKSYAFTATGNLTTLTFSDISTATTGIDLMLDNVKVTAAGGPPNTAPVAANDSYSTNQNTALVVAAAGVLINDTDAESNPLTAVVNVSPVHGNLTLNANGGFTYTPATGYSGPDSFTYHANDGSSDSNIATVSIVVNVVNTAPVAVADSYSANQNTLLVVPAAGVLSNDTDAQSNTLTAIINAGPSHGSLTLNSNGGFSYTPASGYSGPDSFTYHANDGSLNSNIATVSITVNSVNTAPVAAADSFSTNQNTALVVTAAGVLTNDTDAQSNTLTAILSAGPSHGSLSLNANGGFTYTPTTGYTGPDSFTYRANDGSLNSNIATVSINVNAVNTAPVALDDSYSINKNSMLVVSAAGVLTNDTDAQSNPLTAVLSAGPAHGTLTLSPNGSFTYTPATDYTGPDSFTYRANDGSLNSNVATVSITVNAPVTNVLANGSFESDYTAWTKSGNQAIALYPTTDGRKLVAFNGSNLAANGILSQTFPTVSGQTYTLTFDAGILSYVKKYQVLEVKIAGPGSLLSQTITLKGDGDGIIDWISKTYTFVAGSSTATITFLDRSTTTTALDLLLDNVRISGPPAFPNSAPVAAGDTYSANKNTALVIPTTGVLGNDSDPQSDALTAVLESGPAHGTLVLSPNGGFTYTPATGFTGSDSFTYHASDSALNSNTATVTISVNQIPAGILVNPSFESDFSGWTTTGNQSIEFYPATDGIKVVAFNGQNLTPNAVLSQTFATTAGKTYMLTFDAGVFSYTTDPQSLLVTVKGSASLLSRSVNLTGIRGGAFTWAAQSFSFTADSVSTTLTFRDQSTATVGIDLLLDNVRINALPSPSVSSVVTPPPAVNIGVPSLTVAAGNATMSMIAAKTGDYVFERSEDLVTWEILDGQPDVRAGELVEFYDFKDPLSTQAPKQKMFYRIGVREIVPAN